MLMVVKQVVESHLCCGCGACVAACPPGVLQMRMTPAGYLVAHEYQPGCISCGLCLRVCPGRGLADEYLGEAADPFAGPLRQAYWARASQPSLVQSATSGGVVTALLAGLLAKGLVAGALVTRWDPQQPVRPQVFLARTEAELISAQRSKYCPVPVLATLRQLEAGSGPIAVVGTACQLQGLQKLVRQKLKLPEICLTIGLFCDRVQSYHGISQLIGQAGVTESEVEAFEYRSKGQGGWPGDVYVKPRGQQGRYYDRTRRTRMKNSLTPVRCRLCFDKLNVGADVACGDGYGGPESTEGISALLVRTSRGEAALQAVAGQLELTRASAETIMQHQGLQQRKESVAAYTAAYEARGLAATAPLPEACRQRLPAVVPAQLAACSTTLNSDLQWEQSPDEVAARQLLNQRLQRNYRQRFVQRWLSRLGRLLRRGG
jgi:coenzyme F420 hydrogenase subunit beta